MPSLVVEAIANVVVEELGGLEEGDLEALMGEGRGCRATGGAATMMRIWECAGWRGKSACMWGHRMVRHSR